MPDGRPPEPDFAAVPFPARGQRPLLGANGTEAMMSLLARGGPPLVDYLKVGPFQGARAVGSLARTYPLMLHLDDALSDPESCSDTNLTRLREWVRLTGTPWTSAHIGFGVARVALDSSLVTQPLSGPLDPLEALESIAANARALAAALTVPLLLENIPLFPNMAHIAVCEAGFVAQTIDRSGCDLLLDLAHARVTANVLRQDARAYLEQLPLARVVEIHLSGPRRLAECAPGLRAVVLENARSIAHLLIFCHDSLVDAHEPLRDEDYALLEWSLTRTRPKAVTLEYYRDAHTLRTQLLRLREVIGG